MEPSITLLHLSDLQFGRHHRFGRLGLGGPDERFDTLLQRLTDDLAALEHSHQLKPDLIALTGDLAEQGLKAEFAAVQQFAGGLCERLGLPRERLLVVPGNHDINRLKCRGYFDDCEGESEAPVPPYWPKWKLYAEFFGDLYQGVDRHRFTEIEPWTLYEVPDLRVVVAGLNSTMRESHRDEDHYGWLGEGQLRWFADRLRPYVAKGWLRIGLVHHNPLRGATDDDENLRDANDLRDYLGELLNVLLHGHTHLGRDETLGSLPVLSTGSAGVASPQRPEEVPNQYQLIRVSEGSIRCFARQYAVQGKRWIGDTRVSRTGDSWSYERKVALSHVYATFPPPELSAPQVRPEGDVPDEEEEDQGCVADEPNDLLRQVMEICEIRGTSRRFRVTRVRHSGPWGDYARVVEPERGPYLLGAHEGALTQEQLDLWIKDVHDPFRRCGATRGALSQLVVAGLMRLPEALRLHAQERGVLLERLVDYQRVLDVEGYLEDLRARLDSDSAYPRERYIEQRLDAWSPYSPERREVHGAAAWITDRLREPEGSLLLVLGPAGVGKTFLLREVARRLASSQAVVTPLLIELRNLEVAHDVPQLAALYFAQRGLSFPARAFERELREGRIALLFDGFDELALRVKSSAVPAHFERILHAARDQARIVVTSRAEHFLSRGAVDELMVQSSTNITSLGGVLQTVARRQILALKGFERDDVERYLIRALGEARGSERMRRFRAIHDLVGLATNPRMLGFLVDIPDAQLEQAERLKGNLTSAALYRLVIEDSWLKLEHRRLNPAGAALGPTIEALRDAATRLALHLWRNTSRAIDPSELAAHVGDLLTRLCDGEVERATHTLRARTLLIRDDAGRISFIHQTVLEWLVANALAQEIEATQHSVHLEVGRVNEFMIDILREILGETRLVAWADAALEKPGARLGENARDVFKSLGRTATRIADLRGQDLCGQDLSGQELRGALLDDADLSGVRLVGRDLSRASLKNAHLAYADLSDANLKDADLSGADLSFARLNRTDLAEACLTGAVLLGTSLLGARGLPPSAAGATDVGSSRGILSVPRVSPCITVACSPRGWVLASGHANGEILLWDMLRSKLLRVLAGHATKVKVLSWSADCKMLASVSVDGRVCLWNTLDGALRHMLARGPEPVARGLCFSPDGRFLACGNRDGHVRLCPVESTDPPRILPGDAGTVTVMAFSPDGTMLAAGSMDHSDLHVWRLGEPGERMRLVGHTAPILAVTWSPDCAQVASASQDGTVQVWRVTEDMERRTLQGHHAPVTNIAWSPCGDALATVSSDRVLRLWRPDQGSQFRFLGDGAGVVRSISWAADGTTLASGSDDGYIQIWRVDDGTGYSLSLDRSAQGARSTWSPDGSMIAVFSRSDYCRIWSVVRGKVLRSFRVGKAVAHFTWSPDSTRFAFAEGSSILLWSVADEGDPLRIAGDNEEIVALAWNQRSDMITGSFYDGSVHVWSAKDGERLLSLDHVARAPFVHGKRKVMVTDFKASLVVTSIAWSSTTDPRLATGGADGVVLIWKRGLGRVSAIALSGHSDRVRQVAWSPDGTRLASASEDKTVRIFRDDAWGPVLQCPAVVTHVVWSPSGAVLAGLTERQELFLWRTPHGQEVRRFSLAGWRKTRDVVWSRDGRHIVIHTDEGEVRLIDADTGQCVEILRMHVTTGGGGVIARSDGRYYVFGDVAGKLWHASGLHRYEIGELDELVPGGLRMSTSELLFAAGLSSSSES